MNTPELRPASVSDAAAMLALLQAVCAEGDALPFQGGIDQGMVDSLWLGADTCMLACSDNEVVGMYRSGPAMPGRGAHVARATFLVRPGARQRGLGRLLVRHCLDTARRKGYRAMQFNQVLATNAAALALYKSEGFDIVGTIPDAFDHRTLGYVTAHILHRFL